MAKIFQSQIKDLTTQLNTERIKLNTTVSNPSYEEGLLFYDQDTKAPSFYNEESDVTFNLSSEVPICVFNDSGADIPNGKVVYPTGYDNTTGLPTIGIADARDKDKCRLVGMTTHSIENGTTGYVTRLGKVNGIDTTGLTDIVYLTSDGSGDVTNVRPDDGSFEVIIGAVGKVDAVDGSIVVDPNVAHLTVEVTDTNGFPPDQKTGTTLTWDDGTRTLEIAPVGTDFHFYELGKKFEKDSAESIQIDDVSGQHIIYYTNGVLSKTTNPSDAQIETIILQNAIVAFIYWNAVSGEAIIVQDERHGISMSPNTHLYLHKTQGAKYLTGLALENFVIGNGSLASHAQFGNTSGGIADEDLDHSILAVASTTGLTYLYRGDSDEKWYKGTNAGYSFPVGSTPLPQYNEFTGAAWQLTEITSGNYLNLHIFADGNIDGELFAIVGTVEYTKLQDATSGQADEITTILGNLPLPEFVLIGSVIIEGKTSFTNAVQARVVLNDNDEEYTNWTVSELSGGQAPSNHNALAGLQLVDSGVTWGHINNLAQTLYGPKTFNDNVVMNGDLTVNGTTTIINTETLEVEDKNITMGSVTTPTDITADGGGITLLGDTNKTFNWISATEAWTSSENMDIDGHLILQQITAPADTSNKLYNVGGGLYWGDSKLDVNLSNVAYLDQVNTFSETQKIPSITPSADSTTAFQIFKADGTTDIMTVDSTNNRFGFGTNIPNYKVHFHENSTGANWLQFTNTDTGTATTDGFVIGIDANENATFRNREDTSIIFHTNDMLRTVITNDGELFHTGNVMSRPITDNTDAVQFRREDNTTIFNIDTTNDEAIINAKLEVHLPPSRNTAQEWNTGSFPTYSGKIMFDEWGGDCSFVVNDGADNNVVAGYSPDETKYIYGGGEILHDASIGTTLYKKLTVDTGGIDIITSGNTYLTLDDETYSRGIGRRGDRADWFTFYMSSGRFRFAGTNDGSSGSEIAAFTSASSKFYGDLVIASGKYIGIGTDSPDELLHIMTPADTWGGIKIQETGVTDESFIIRQYGSTTSGSVLEQEGDLPIRFFTNGSEHFRVNGDGNVGVGTIEPSYSLDVSGDIRGTGYRSSDGSAGISQTITIPDATDTSYGFQMVFKNGILTESNYITL